MTDDEKGYNGWKNYETWLVALWIDNDQSSYSYARELKDQVKDNEHARYDLSHALKEWIESDNPLNDDATLFTDLLNAALSEVDWYEIAENYLSEVE